jgi:hypothetical protein
MTLRVDRIENQSGSAGVPADTVIEGSAKAWANFNGTGTIAIRDSFNISSLIDIATGNQSVNFTSDMNATDYAHFGSGSFYYATGWGSANWSVGSYSPELGSVKIHTSHNHALYDFQNVNLSVFGDLA